MVDTTYEVNAKIVAFGAMMDVSVEYATISGAQNAENVLTALENKERTLWSTEEQEVLENFYNPAGVITDVEFISLVQLDRTVI